MKEIGHEEVEIYKRADSVCFKSKRVGHIRRGSLSQDGHQSHSNNSEWLFSRLTLKLARLEIPSAQLYHLGSTNKKEKPVFTGLSFP